MCAQIHRRSHRRQEARTGSRTQTKGFFKFNFVFSGVCQNLEVSHRFSCNHRGQDDSLDWVRGQFESSNQKGNYEHNQIEMSHKTNLICLMTYNWFYVTYIVFWVFLFFFVFLRFHNYLSFKELNTIFMTFLHIGEYMCFHTHHRDCPLFSLTGVLVSLPLNSLPQVITCVTVYAHVTTN